MSCDTTPSSFEVVRKKVSFLSISSTASAADTPSSWYTGPFSLDVSAVSKVCT